MYIKLDLKGLSFSAYMEVAILGKLFSLSDSSYYFKVLFSYYGLYLAVLGTN